MWMRSYTFDEYFIQMCGLMLQASYAPCLNSTIYKYFQDNFVLLQLLKSFPPLPKLCFLLTLNQVSLCLLKTQKDIQCLILCNNFDNLLNRWFPTPSSQYCHWPLCRCMCTLPPAVAAQLTEAAVSTPDTVLCTPLLCRYRVDTVYILSRYCVDTV